MRFNGVQPRLVGELEIPHRGRIGIARRRVAGGILNTADPVKDGIPPLNGRAQYLDLLLGRQDRDRADGIILRPFGAVLLLRYRVDIARVLQPADELLPGLDEGGARCRIAGLQRRIAKLIKLLLRASNAAGLLQIEGLVANRKDMAGDIGIGLQRPEFARPRIGDERGGIVLHFLNCGA
jgi:hypothetical protein